MSQDSAQDFRCKLLLTSKLPDGAGFEPADRFEVQSLRSGAVPGLHWASPDGHFQARFRKGRECSRML